MATAMPDPEPAATPQPGKDEPVPAPAQLKPETDEERDRDDRLDSATRRTALAADRTVFAAERTYAAWVRTGLGALASGVGARALLAGVVHDWFAGLAGSVLVLFSAFCFIAAIWRQLQPRTLPTARGVRRIPPALLIGVNGFLVLVALAALIGIWSEGLVRQ